MKRVLGAILASYVLIVAIGLGLFLGPMTEGIDTDQGEDKDDPQSNYDDADPPIDDQFESLRKVVHPDGTMEIYDPDDPDERWVSSSDMPYLTDKL